MNTNVFQAEGSGWLVENAPGELALLLRAIIFDPSVPILLADDNRQFQDASVGAAKLLGFSREGIVGRRIDDFAEPDSRPELARLWRDFLKEGEQHGTLRLLNYDGMLREVEYTAKANVMHSRHALFLGGKAAKAEAEVASSRIPASVQDYALYVLDTEERVSIWYAGAARLYGYQEHEAIGQHLSFLFHGLHADEDSLRIKLRKELKRTAEEGHLCTEGWQARKSRPPFWANVVSITLRDARGNLQGFAAVVRDFSDRHASDEKLQRVHARRGSLPAQATVVGIVSGEFERIPEANDAFLDLVGYSREELARGEMNWPDLSAPEYAALDGYAHEEELRFGSCTPFEKELIRKDGIRVPVLVTTAVLKLSPFRWITFVQDLRERDRLEIIEDGAAEAAHGIEEMVGISQALKRVQLLAEVVAPTDATVLILGETGTGKELVARAIHRMSPRRDFPCITLNCAAIPTGLLESELFGYERGAFTGALTQKIGRFEMAHRGTLFLDEVGDIPLDLQPKLLRALQEKSFERLGGTKTIPIDVRLLAATNRNLARMMDDKLFRSDLYYRLKVFPITTPPLRDRPEDIPILARHFTKKYAAKMGRRIETISSKVMLALVNWRWPGNVRELENFIERAVILSKGPNLDAPIAEIKEDALERLSGATLEQVEREHIIRVFRESGGVVTTAATRLGLHRTTLNAIMRKIGISRKDL